MVNPEMQRKKKQAGFSVRNEDAADSTAVVLAAGSGKRMSSDVPKQYMELGGCPVLYYSLSAFQRWEKIRQIIIVCRKEDISYCQKEIVEKYHLTKVKAVVAGGENRYDSVEAGIACADTSYVWIHDGARPFVTRDMLERLLENVKEKRAVIAAVPVKDTIKKAGGDGRIEEEPDRSALWQAQTPQVFETAIIKKAYEIMKKTKEEDAGCGITDDAMLVRRYAKVPSFVVMGEYRNIKLTTPEDFEAAHVYLKKYCLTETETIC